MSSSQLSDLGSFSDDDDIPADILLGIRSPSPSYNTHITCDNEPEISNGHLAASRAMRVPEVVTMVLSHADRPSLAAALRVAGLWSSAARPYLWGELDSVIPLFELLSPMGIGHQRTWKFTRDPADFEWDRFRLHSVLVKKLTFDSGKSFQNEVPRKIPDHALTYVIVGHPFGTALLPNLRVLVCPKVQSEDVFLITSLLSPSLAHFSISLGPNPSSEWLRGLLKRFKYRTPGLQVLRIATGCPAAFIGRDLAAWIQLMPTLRSIDLPRFFYTAELIGALAKRNGLEALTTNSEFGQRFAKDGVIFSSTVRDFPALRTLNLDMQSNRVVELLRRSPNLAQLTTIAIGSLQVDSRQNLKILLDAFGTTCHNLEHLTLDFSDSTVPLDSSDLQSLFECHKISSLDIRHSPSVELTVGDAEALGKAWPDIKRLMLCHEPNLQDVSGSPATSMEILPVLAEHCQHLKELGLFFDKDTLPRFDGKLEAKFQLQRLRELDVGRSLVPQRNWSDVAFFLASLCPGGVCLKGGGFDAESTNDWKVVENVFNTAVKLKAAARGAA